MKALSVIAFLASLSAVGQALPPAPVERPIELRLDQASEHMRKAGRDRIASLVVLSVGSLMVLANESQRTGNAYDERITWAFTGFTAGAFITIQGLGAHRDRKSAKALHQ